MRRMKGLGSAAVALVAVLGVASAAPVSASERTAVAHAVDVTQVPVGPSAHIDYLTGRLLHTRSGRVIQLPFPKQYQDSLELVGRTRHGWLVVYHHTATIYEVSPEGSLRKVLQYDYDQGYEGYSIVSLSTNRRLIAIQPADPGGSIAFEVFDLAGHHVGYHSWSDGGGLEAFRGRSLYVSLNANRVSHEKLERWDLGTAPVDTGLRAVTVLGLAHDEYMRYLAGRRNGFGLASLSHPDGIRWTMCGNCHGGQSFFPRSFSPDGTRVVIEGGATYPSKRVVVRATSDGHIITDLRFDAEVWRERWEDSRHVLVEVIRRQAGQSLYQAEKAVLRCGLAGQCTRVTVWQHHFILDYEPPGGL